MDVTTDEQLFELFQTPIDEILTRVRGVVGHRFGVSDEQVRLIIKAAVRLPVSDAEVAKAAL